MTEGFVVFEFNIGDLVEFRRGPYEHYRSGRVVGRSVFRATPHYDIEEPGAEPAQNVTDVVPARVQA